MIENSSSLFGRTGSLAQPKRNRCLEPRSSYYNVSLAALKYNPTDRILSLSLPKIRKDFHTRTEFSRFAYDPQNSGVWNKAALQAECSDHIATLARPKSDYKGYKFANPVIRTVSKSAKNATASERVIQLSAPKIKKENLIK